MIKDLLPSKISTLILEFDFNLFITSSFDFSADSFESNLFTTILWRSVIRTTYIDKIPGKTLINSCLASAFMASASIFEENLILTTLINTQIYLIVSVFLLY